MRIRTGRGYVLMLTAVFIILLSFLLYALQMSAADGIQPEPYPAYLYSARCFYPCAGSGECLPEGTVILPAALSLAEGKSFSELIHTSSGVSAGIDPAVARDPEYRPGIMIDAPVHIPAEELPSGLPEYDFTLPVAETPETTNDWFADALFIGDSRTVGMMAYSGVKSTYYAKVGLTIRGVTSNRFIEDPDDPEQLLTVLEAVERDAKYKKVYISFGLNESGWGSNNIFVNTYKYVIEQLRALLPDAAIYIQAIIPVTSRVSDKNPSGLNNAALRRYNGQLAELAASERVFYLAIDEPFTNADGVLPDKGGDGIHLSGADVRAQFDYLRKHAVDMNVYEWKKDGGKTA